MSNSLRPINPTITYRRHVISDIVWRTINLQFSENEDRIIYLTVVDPSGKKTEYGAKDYSDPSINTAPYAIWSFSVSLHGSYTIEVSVEGLTEEYTYHLTEDDIFGHSNNSNNVLGDLDAGIYIDIQPYSQFYDRVGTGTAKVIMSDIFGQWIGEGNDRMYVFGGDTHGFRVSQSFIDAAMGSSYSLFRFSGTSHTSIDAVETDETVIISASAHSSFDSPSDQAVLDAVEELKNSDALLLSSLENSGVQGVRDEDGNLIVNENPHEALAEAIIDDAEALDQTIFIGAKRGTTGRVDLQGGFVENNLDHIIFVDMTGHPSGVNTSHATPVLAAHAVELLNLNPDLTAEELKTQIMNNTTREEITVTDIQYDSETNSYIDHNVTINALTYTPS